MESQCNRVLKYMETHGSINQRAAMEELGCMRLASRISDLRRAGHSIKRQFVKGKNRYGEPVRFAEYKLIEKGDE